MGPFSDKPQLRRNAAGPCEVYNSIPCDARIGSGMQFHRGRIANWSGVALVWIGVALASAGVAQDAGPPLPPPRPDRPTVPSPGDPERPEEEPAGEKTDEADAPCLERITQLGLRYEARPAVREDACSVQSPVLVSALPNGVEVSPASLMTCPVAENLAKWMGDVVADAAERHLRSSPTKLLIGTSYQCRSQRTGEKLSEHAFGNAVDVMGFEFSERAPLAIKPHPEGTPEAEFQSAVRKGACPIFSTVLGPGSDDAHDDHLHLDMRARKGDYRICQ